MPAGSILENAICVSLARRRLGLTKTIKSSEFVAGTADKAMIHAQKSLFDSQELKRIFSLDVKIDSYMASRGLPFPLKRSVYLLPLDLFMEVENTLTEYQKEWNTTVTNFCAVYDSAVLAAKDRLGNLFNTADYPTVEQVKASFQFSWQYLDFSVSAKLKEVSADILEREQKKMEAEWKQASDAIQTMLRVAMQDLVNHLVDRLSPGEDGKKKVFHTSTLDKINDFLTTFNARNLTGDQALKDIVDQAKALTEGVTPDVLRSNEALRSNMATGFTAIKEKLSNMIIEAPMRSIRLED